MDVNVTSFKVEFRDFVRVSIQTAEREKVDSYPAEYIIARDELPLVLKCIRGESKFHPLFQDGRYKIAFYPAEIYAIELHETQYSQWHFILPFRDLPGLQERLQAWYDNPSETVYELTSENLARIRCENRIE